MKNTTNAIKLCITVVQVFIVSILVSLFWQGLEMIILGHLNPNGIDTIITYILSISLVYNAKFLYRMREIKREEDEKVQNRY